MSAASAAASGVYIVLAPVVLGTGAAVAGVPPGVTGVVPAGLAGVTPPLPDPFSPRRGGVRQP